MFKYIIAAENDANFSFGSNTNATHFKKPVYTNLTASLQNDPNAN